MKRATESKFKLLSGIGAIINFVVISGFVVVVVIAFPALGPSCSDVEDATEGKQIFEGIGYGCERLEPTGEGTGVVHWVRIDLTAPGIELYVTPLDPTAVDGGWQYYLRWVGTVVKTKHLAVAVNGTLFYSKTKRRPWLRGDLAKSIGPLVADSVVSRTSDDNYLLWFDDQLMPHLGPSKPLALADFVQAKWGIGAQVLFLKDGRVRSDVDYMHSPDARTAVAVDPDHKILFLAVGTHISPRLMFQILADLGAKDGMLLDGGSSSSLAIGKHASGVPAGTVYGGWHPVATQFGVRARPFALPIP